MNNERMNNEQWAKHCSLSHCSLFIVLAAFALLGLAYSAAIPLFEAPDELQHYATVQYISRYAWFPPLGKPAEHLWDQEALQAPLYYWLGAAATFWIDTSDFNRQAILQPKPNIGDANLPGKKNAFLHGVDQAFPYHNTTLAVHVARWMSLLFGAGTLLLTFVAARLVFLSADATDISLYPLKPLYPLSESATVWLPLLAAAFLAFIPQFIFIHSVVSNDPAITFTSTLTLVLLLWFARDGIAPRRAALFGLAVGLMALSKLIGAVLAGVAVVLFTAIAVADHRPERSRRMLMVLQAIGITVAAAALLSGWWYVRNQIVYGDPLALKAFLEFVGASFSIAPVSAGFLWDQFRLLRFSTWGLFGHISVLMEPTFIYSIYDAIAFVGVFGVVVGAGRVLVKVIAERGIVGGVASFASKNRTLMITLVWFGAVLAIAARWFFAAGIQGRLIFPGLPAASILLAYGLYSLFNRVPSRTLALALALPMMAFAAFVVPAYLIPAYSPPPLIDSIPAAASPANAVFADEIALRGYTIARRGDQLRLTFYWEALKTPSADYTVAIRLVRGDGSFWLDYVNYPGMGTSLPTTWKPGELRRDEYVFATDRFPAETGRLRLIVGFFDPRVKGMTAVTGWDDVREAGWVALTEMKIDDEQ